MVAAIVRAIAPTGGVPIVEIGPGQGALTAALLAALGAQSGARLTAIEIDRDLIATLHRRYAPQALELIEGDCLAIDFSALAAARGGRLRVVGNLPYNISTPLLFHLDRFAAVVVDLHFMLQREVVDRMSAAPGGKVYGRLSVMLQAGWQVVPLFDVPPTAFDPPPQVDSAVVRLVPAPERRAQIRDRGLFDAIVSAGFAQRRKMLRNALADWYASGGAELRAIIDPSARAEQVPLEQWCQFANAIALTRVDTVGGPAVTTPGDS